MGNTVDTQMMVHRSTEFTKDNSIQLHRTDVSQETFTKEMKLRAQKDRQKPLEVDHADGDIQVRSDAKTPDKRQPSEGKRKRRPSAKDHEHEEERALPETGSTFDVRI